MKTSTTREIVSTILMICVFVLILFLIFNIGMTSHSFVANDSNARNSEPVNSCYDLSDHNISFVRTQPGVTLEVLDWAEQEIT